MNEHPSKGIYVSLGPKPPDDLQLDRSLLLLLKELPSSKQAAVFAEVFWCSHQQRHEHLGTTHIVVSDTPKPLSVERFPLGECLPFAQLEATVGDCASFVGDRRVYRRLLRLAGPELGRRLLTRAHDIAALQAYAKNSRVLRAVRASGQLSNLLRSSEEQFAFLSLEKLIAEGDRASSLPPAISVIDGALRVEARTVLRFVARYGEVLGEIQPVTAVIGANGVGKTRLLLALSDCAKRAELEATPAGELEGSFDARVAPPDIVSFTYEPVLWAKQRRAGVTVIPLGVGAREWHRLGAVLQQLALADQTDFQVRAYINVIRTIVEPEDIWLPIAGAPENIGVKYIGQKTYIQLASLANASDPSLGYLDPTGEIAAWSPLLGKYALSSGQRSLMLLIAHLFLHCEHRLVLMDEPENHLHPQYITKLMRTLHETLIATESRAVVVTHSPFVVRELDKGAVQILSKDTEGLPCLYQTSFQTFGGDVGQITDYVFGDRQIQKGYEVLVQRAMERASPQTRDEVAHRVSRQIGDDAELYLQNILRDPSDAH